MKWKIKEIMNNLLGEFPSKKVEEFLNSLPEERALEAKVVMMSGSPLAYVFYRE